MKSKHFVARFKDSDLGTKKDIANFVRKTDFEDKVKNVNQKVTSNKTKHGEGEKKLIELSENVKVFSTKRYKFPFLR